jgi:hypothetical protein
MLIWIRAALLGLCLALLGSQCFGAPERKKPAAKPKAAHPPHSAAQRPARLPAPLLQDGVAELRLIEIYRLIGQSETRAALNLAESLVRDFPDFALAQLVYGDLLTARTQAIEQFGNVPASDLKKATPALNGLRLESQMRLRALRERPPQRIAGRAAQTLAAKQTRHRRGRIARQALSVSEPAGGAQAAGGLLHFGWQAGY